MNNIEIYNILMVDDVIESINNNKKILLNLIPELAVMFGFNHHHPHHHLNVWDHTILALSLSDKDFEVRLALLLHDIGKPFCYQESNGVRHFKGHNEESFKISKRIFDRLKFNDELKIRILYLILNHDISITQDDIIKNYELSLKRYEVQRCDILAHNPNFLEKRIKYLDETKKLIYKNKN